MAGPVGSYSPQRKRRLRRGRRGGQMRPALRALCEPSVSSVVIPLKVDLLTNLDQQSKQVCCILVKRVRQRRGGGRVAPLRRRPRHSGEGHLDPAARVARGADATALAGKTTRRSAPPTQPGVDSLCHPIRFPSCWRLPVSPAARGQCSRKRRRWRSFIGSPAAGRGMWTPSSLRSNGSARVPALCWA